MKTTPRTDARGEQHGHGAGLQERHSTRLRARSRSRWARSAASTSPATPAPRSPRAEDHRALALDLLDDMLAIRELEEMIVRLRSGGYDPLPGYDYRGPTHVSIGQEATSVGACTAIRDPTTTSPARTAATATRSPRASPRSGRCRRRPAGPRAVVEGQDRDGLLADALEEHVYRVDRRALRQGRGLLPRSRRRHAHRRLLDRPSGRQRDRRRQRPDRDRRGDGAPLPRLGQGRLLLRRRRRVRQRRRPRGAQLGLPGAVDQPPCRGARGRPAGHLPDRQQPLRHDPSHRRRGDGRRPPGPPRAGFAQNNMHAETVNGMDVLAVRDAIERAARSAARATARSSSRRARIATTATPSPTRATSTGRAKKRRLAAVDPIERLKGQLIAAGVADAAGSPPSSRAPASATLAPPSEPPRRPTRPGRPAQVPLHRHRRRRRPGSRGRRRHLRGPARRQSASTA
jgi:hypothetical protein